MNDDELKRLWQKQKLDAPARLPDNVLVARMKSKMRVFNHTIFWRDVWEIGACVLIFTWAIYEFTRYPAVLCRAGSVVLMLASMLIPWKLITGRRAVPAVPGSAPINDFIHGEIERVNNQTRLLNSVLWWYLLPLFIGLGLLLLGLSGSLIETGGALLFVVPVFWFVYWLNRYAVRKNLLPLKQELEHVLDPENAPAPKNPYPSAGFQLRIKLFSRTFEFPQECTMPLRFCIAMNVFWITLPCSMLRSTDIPGQTIPGWAAIVVIVAIIALLVRNQASRKTRPSLGKIFVLAILALSGLFGMAWGFNILRVLLT